MVCTTRLKIYKRSMKSSSTFFHRAYKFFFFYVPYKSYLYYRTSPTPKFSAFVLLLFLSSSNVFSLFLLANQFFGWEFSGFTGNRIVNKFVVIPLLLSPFVLLALLFYTHNKEAMKQAVIDFENYSELNQKMGNRYYWLYVGASIALFFSALSSPLWLKL